jgi:dTDP-4-dehydrorhamnose reductase
VRILLTGVHGQLGTDLRPLLQPLGEVLAAGRAECDLASAEAIRKLVTAARPDVIVNPAAYTAVNDAEAHPELAYAINATAPGVLAEEARKAGAMLVHYSTDYVFDGAKPEAYTEDDVPAPLNVYGASKLAGERAVAAAGGRFLVLRTSWVYGANGNNFLKTILRLAAEREELKIVDDQVGAPTSSLQLAQATARLVGQLSAKTGPEFPSGLYHATAGGSVSWCGFAQAIVATLKAEAGEPLRVRRILPIRSEEYPTPARRPLNSVLSSQMFERTFGFRLESWQQGLADVVREIRLREADRSAGKNAL